MINPWWKFKA